MITVLRVIKFRGKRLANSKWSFGSLLVWTNGECTILEKSDSSNAMWKREIDPSTVGQFTGLHDADGREIYEGDIVRLERDGLLYAVIFWEGMFYASVEACNRGIYGGFPLHSFTRDSVCRIVGNVHDDPGLLKA